MVRLVVSLSPYAGTAVLRESLFRLIHASQRPAAVKKAIAEHQRPDHWTCIEPAAGSPNAHMPFDDDSCVVQWSEDVTACVKNPRFHVALEVSRDFGRRHDDGRIVGRSDLGFGMDERKVPLMMSFCRPCEELPGEPFRLKRRRRNSTLGGSHSASLTPLRFGGNGSFYGLKRCRKEGRRCGSSTDSPRRAVQEERAIQGRRLWANPLSLYWTWAEACVFLCRSRCR